ncbi:hypothetical protein [Actinoplanes utahensis]|uniref:Uncharacterized protein n=1 Tax=Actinoplanes utahensis TaxID=1869 RepID=A0A0A6UG83_ACTUT|nr:hypothetical protein [Actinoplanes utahensis]KHD75070.1 hypothetical protein MB27_25200 [Actinoplanes utahensis]GIF28477.1 hypothetical protein Aut01nite_14630 [Actinoplanes utahensis]
MTEARGFAIPRGWRRFAAGDVEMFGDQTLRAVHVAPAEACHRLRDDHDDRIRELDPITAAKALRELSEVLP